MHIRDYNGTGLWTVVAVRERYAEYSKRLNVAEPLNLCPMEYRHGDAHWIYPIMEAVIAGIKNCDPACALIGIEFIEEDRKFAFGANLKSRTARALRQSVLSESQKARIRRRVVKMLEWGNTPREYREYVKLLRKIGFEEIWPQIEAGAPRENKYAMRYFGYLRAIHETSAAVVKP